MPSSQIVSTAAEPKDLDKAYKSALTALSVLGVKMVTKKPDTVKVTTIMIKAKKKAEFKLVHTDGDKVMLTVECASESMMLGELDMQAIKDPKNYIVGQRALFKAKLISKESLEKAIASVAPGPNPKIANKIREKIEEFKTNRKPYETTKTYDAAVKNTEYFKELQAFAVKGRNAENLMFIAAVEKKFSRDKIMKAFVNSDAKMQLNLSSIVSNNLIGGSTDFGPAVDEIKKHISDEMISNLNDDKRAIIDKAIKLLEDQLAKLPKM